MTRWLALSALLVLAVPGAAQAQEAGTSCAQTRPDKAMADCLLGRAVALLGDPAMASKEASTRDVLWDWVSQTAGATGNTEKLRASADRITDPNQRRVALGRLGTHLAGTGDTRGAVAVLDAMLAEPLPPNARQVDWGAVSILAALDNPARIKAYLESWPAERRVNALLGLVRVYQESKRMDRAAALIKEFGAADSNAGVPIILHSRTALDFVKAGRLEAARQTGRLLPDSDRLRMEARLALKLFDQGKRDEAVKAMTALLAAAPRSTDARLAASLMAARTGDFAAMRARFPTALSYDQALLDDLWALLAEAGQSDEARALIATMNNGKDRIAASARMALLLAKDDPAGAARFVADARAVIDPILADQHGAPQRLMDFGPALRTLTEAHIALGQRAEAAALVALLEQRFAADRYGLRRSRATETLAMTNQVLLADRISRGDAAAVTAAVDPSWRALAARRALLEAKRFKDAVTLAERENPDIAAKTGDILAVAQYIAKH
ncbi:hypothetical protein [Iodidimonas sp. SYSU 1G8]|uniref:tetratricopeptide repeat protein n=1 Tax=Iodidimonas sp. SYSU 1G8 TaxID=3133967 RepID=UPI0031FE7BBE